MGYNQNIANFMREHKVFSKRYANVTDDDIIVKEFQKLIILLFNGIKNMDGFLALFNMVNSVIYTKSHPLKIQHLTYHAFHNKHKYSHFLIAKKTGGTRTIHAPVDGLKNIQKTLNVIFQCIYKTPMAVHGFTENRSVVTNARLHVGKNYLYNIDLKDFFPSIHKARIEKRLEYPPFNFNGEKKEIATLIGRLVTQKVFEFTNEKTGQKEILSEDIIRELAAPSKKVILDGFMENINLNVYKKYAALPQGAPTSPIFSNIICERLDRRLLGLAKKYGVKYTRYADDMTFSSMHNVYQKDSEFIKEMHRIIEDQRFEINPKKTRLQKRGYRQEVTGVIVNDKTNVTRRYIKKLRAMLYSIEKFGLEKAEVKFEIDYKKDRVHIKNKVPSMLNVLQGKLEYLKMVKGAEDSTYLKLKHRLDQIINPVFSEKGNEFVEPDKEKSYTNLKVEHHPEKMVELLCKFTSKEPLKSVTHPSKTNDKYDKFIEDINKEWKELSKKYQNYITDKLRAKIWRFISDTDFEKGWGKCWIKFGWSSPELKKWCNSNSDNYPTQFKIELDEKQKCKKDISTFSDVINKFKAEIEISPSNNDMESFLFSIIDRIFDEKEFNIQIDDDSEECMEEAKFFIDTQWLKEGLELVFEEIKTKKKYSKNIKIKMEQTKNYYRLQIIHLSSTSKMKPSKIKKRIKKGAGTFPKLIDKFTSICDLSIESSYHENNFSIELLGKKNQRKSNKIQKETLNDFIYTLRFYKCRM